MTVQKDGACCSSLDDCGYIVQIPADDTVEGITFVDANGDTQAVTFSVPAANAAAAVDKINETLLAYGFVNNQGDPVGVRIIEPTDAANSIIVISTDGVITSLQHDSGTTTAFTKTTCNRVVEVCEYTIEDAFGTDDIVMNGTTYDIGTNTPGSTAVATVRTNIINAISGNEDYLDVTVDDETTVFRVTIIAPRNTTLSIGGDNFTNVQCFPAWVV